MVKQKAVYESGNGHIWKYQMNKTSETVSSFHTALYPRPILDSIYLTSILVVQYLQISLHNDDNEMV